MRPALRLFTDYLAPILLIAIASVQIYRAHTVGQSPWKGGGFGMFSTVDSPGARYVRTFVVTEDGADLEVSPPSIAYMALERLRVIPSQHLLDKVAEATAETPWLWADYDPLREIAPPPAGTGGPGTLQLASAAAPPAPEILVPPDTRGPFRPIDQPRVRAARAGEPDPPDSARVPVAAGRSELWRMRFDGATRRLTNELVMSAIHERREPVEEEELRAAID